MIQLLINRECPEAEPSTSFGGLPVKGLDEDFQWPICQSCNGAMQFLGKLAVDGRIEQVFMCQNDPGLCNEWDADGGGNSVVVTAAREFELATPPEGGVTTKETNYGAVVLEFDSDDYEEARTQWAEENGLSLRQVLGQVFGTPSWIQGDETPNCDICKKPMRFVAQLEQGPDWKDEMDFGGGGCAYLFDCTCDSSAKFMWQC
ncbi:hypothetical protein [Microbulbifer halophilus]|uniref:DUF1963 domain-containing protein n=1 Tax=Microbulbifer halophilus TaxID=453963 RepID=A0ABW5EGY9_9GAMM|nr:hypothetical protein [Microbulbifer halophilus]MCW8128685.1 hypothetical protein [Microbulbifer halophilus]